MSAIVIKFFRESHRDPRLGPLRMGQDWHVEVRPLSLTPQPRKIINIKHAPTERTYEQFERNR